ncbi:hypothetical protein HK096_009927, partial [Nowakowskiella sp. JEL0078]
MSSGSIYSEIEERDKPKINGISLNDIIDGKVETISNSLVADIYEDDEMEVDDKKTVSTIKTGFCVECEGVISFYNIRLKKLIILDQPAELFCEQCADDYCSVCYASQHRKGSRKKHSSKKLEVNFTLSASESVSAGLQ